MERSTILMIVYMVLMGLCLLFTIVGLATTSWYEFDQSYLGYTGHLGLWKYCGSKGDTTACRSLPEQLRPSWLHGVRAAIIFGMLFIIAAAGLVIVSLILTDLKKRLFLGSVIGCFLAGLLLLIGVIAYAANDSSTYASGSNGYSLALTVLAALFGFGAGGVGVASMIMDR